MNEDEENLNSSSYDNLSFMQCADCQSPIISNVLCTIKNSAIIIHSPIGCASSFIDFNIKFKKGLKKRGLPIRNARLVSSNITESDIIFDVDKKLKIAIDKCIENFDPKVIFVTSSCGSGITVLDIQNVINSIQNQYSIPLIIISCELYNSPVWSSGAKLRQSKNFSKLVKVNEYNEKFYNVINFSDNDDIKEILNKIPVNWNYISRYAEYECLEKMGGALGTILISPDRFGKYMAEWLRNEFNIPYINKTLPYGIKSTDDFFKEIDIWFKNEFLVCNVIYDYKKKYLYSLGEIKNKLNDIRCFPILMGYGYEKSMLEMLKDLEVNIIDYDSKYEMIFDNSNMPFFKKQSIGSLYGLQGVKISFNQAYVLINFINNINPDLIVVKHYSLRDCTVKMGIPTLWIEDELDFYGYKGSVQFAQRLLDLVSNKKFAENIKMYSKSSYKEWWIKKNLLKKV